MGRFVFAFLILCGILTVQSMADRSELKIPRLVHLSLKSHASFIANPPVEAGDHGVIENSVAESPEEVVVRKISKHHSTDKSVAGGGVIIGGLVTAIFAAVYCYIRVTRKKSSSDGDKQ
ncbi:hypothetical protein ACH5RR_029019 [Cinchona calisaya]|uniref:Transmembrane protein n=1 Tax=Cinchona calisaya TaxID=153742 RepID=A0ABD2YRN5_9GENT